MAATAHIGDALNGAGQVVSKSSLAVEAVILALASEEDAVTTTTSSGTGWIDELAATIGTPLRPRPHSYFSSARFDLTAKAFVSRSLPQLSQFSHSPGAG